LSRKEHVHAAIVA
jgi:hypothetical protein